MRTLKAIIRAIHEGEDGHAVVALPGLIAAVGAIVLAIGAAGASSITAYIGGAALALGIAAAGVIRHREIDYDIFDRLEKLEK